MSSIPVELVQALDLLDKIRVVAAAVSATEAMALEQEHAELASELHDVAVQMTAVIEEAREAVQSVAKEHDVYVLMMESHNQAGQTPADN